MVFDLLNIPKASLPFMYDIAPPLTLMTDAYPSIIASLMPSIVGSKPLATKQFLGTFAITFPFLSQAPFVPFATA